MGGYKQPSNKLFSVLQSHLARSGVRSAVGNFGWMVAERGMRLVCSVLVGFWVARYLGPGQFGLLGYTLAWVGIGTALVEFGLEGIVRREVLRNPAEAGRTISAARFLRLAAGMAAYLLLVGSTFVAGAGKQEVRLAALLGLLFFQPGLSVADLWLHAHLKARVAVLAQLPGLVLGTLAKVSLILMGAPLVAFAGTMVLEVLLSIVVLNVLARKAGFPTLAPAVRPACVALFRESWPLLLSSLGVVVYMRTDTLMLRHYLGEEAVGVFVAATRISESSYFVPLFLASSILPALLRARQQGPAIYAVRFQQYYDGSAALAYVFAGGMIVAAPWLIPLAYGPAYAGSIPVLMVHALTQFGALLGVARGQYLVNEGHMRFYSFVTLSGAGVNVLLNLWLIPRYGPVGAAWATVAAQAVSVWFTSFLWSRTRSIGWMQTKALLVPVLGWRYLRR